jgi:hypothetical protein
LLSAAVAVYRHRRAPVPTICLILSGVILWVFDHPGPFGALAFAMFFLGAFSLQFGQRGPGALVKTKVA